MYIAVSVMCIFLMVLCVGLLYVIVACADPEGDRGSGDSGPPEKGFPSNTGQDPLKNHKV